MKTNWKPHAGVSLHCLANPVDPADASRLEGSCVETLEISPALLQGEAGAALKAALASLERTRVASVHALFGGANDISLLEEPARRRAIEQGRSDLRLAEELGADLLVVHASGEPVSDEERPRRLAQCRRSLAELSEEAKDRNVRLVVELLPRSCLGNTVDELAALLDGLDPSMVGVCLDTNHGMDRWAELPQWVEQLGERLWEVHVSDYDGVDEKHDPPGQGVLDWGAFANALEKIGFQGPFNYECRWPGDTFAERLQALEENFQWINSSACGGKAAARRLGGDSC